VAIFCNSASGSSFSCFLPDNEFLEQDEKNRMAEKRNTELFIILMNLPVKINNHYTNQDDWLINLRILKLKKMN